MILKFWMLQQAPLQVAVQPALAFALGLTKLQAAEAGEPPTRLTEQNSMQLLLQQLRMEMPGMACHWHAFSASTVCHGSEFVGFT